jgi:uncharacterized protein YjbI with pentapeptide repeats
MSSIQQQETDLKESAATKATSPKQSSSRRFALIVLSLILLAGVFLFVRNEDRKSVHRLLISNASFDQENGLRKLLRNPQRYQAVWRGLVLDRLDLGALRFASVEFRQCDFSGARFDASEFSGCRFLDCNFRGCDMRKAKIRNSVFEGCNFSYADFEEASLQDTDISNSDFQNARIAAKQLKGTKGWESAVYGDQLREALEL